jgi:hypothetical protein
VWELMLSEPYLSTPGKDSPVVYSWLHRERPLGEYDFTVSATLEECQIASPIFTKYCPPFPRRLQLAMQ